MEDVEIIDLLFARDENALELITEKYKNLYNGVIGNIIDDSLDVKECENDLLLGVWNSIPPNRPDNLPAYICKIARNISINKFKHNNRLKRNNNYTLAVEELDECIPDNRIIDYANLSERRELIEFINKFVKELDEQTRVLFIRRYFYLESVSDLAARFSISENLVSVKLFRTRKKLCKLLEKEGFKS